MLKVKAKCIARAWDNGGEILRVSPSLCNIESTRLTSDGQLAKLTVNAVAYDAKGSAIRYFRDHEGTVKSIPIPKPPYIFEFDRNATSTDEGVIVSKDYSCKKCGVDFKNLADLGSHSNSSFHKGDDLITDDEPVQPKVDGRSKRVFTCKTCGKVCPNLYAMGVHNKTHVKAAET